MSRQSRNIHLGEVEPCIRIKADTKFYLSVQAGDPGCHSLSLTISSKQIEPEITIPFGQCISEKLFPTRANVNLAELLRRNAGERNLYIDRRIAEVLTKRSLLTIEHKGNALSEEKIIYFVLVYGPFTTIAPIEALAVSRMITIEERDDPTPEELKKEELLAFKNTS